MRRGSDAGVFDVFAKFGTDPAEPIRWVGSVRSGDPELAWLAAKEIYTRREDCTVLWVAERTAMVVSEPGDVEILRSSDRLNYRLPPNPGRHRRDRLKEGPVQPVEGVAT